MLTYTSIILTLLSEKMKFTRITHCLQVVGSLFTVRNKDDSLSGPDGEHSSVEKVLVSRERYFG